MATGYGEELSHKIPRAPQKFWDWGWRVVLRMVAGAGIEIPRLRLGMTWGKEGE